MTAPGPTGTATLADALAAQDRSVRTRLDGGATVVGVKIALGSAAAQQRTGATGPIWGWLTDDMRLADGDVIEPRPAGRTMAEAELVFELGADLVGPGVEVTDVLAATAALRVGLELPCHVPHRLAGALGMVASNAGADRFVLGEPVTAWQDADLAALPARLTVNDDVQHGSGAAVAGHPARAVARLANDLAAADGRLAAGLVVFTGALTVAVKVRPGDTLTAEVARLGRVGVRVRH